MMDEPQARCGHSSIDDAMLSPPTVLNTLVILDLPANARPGIGRLVEPLRQSGFDVRLVCVPAGGDALSGGVGDPLATVDVVLAELSTTSAGVEQALRFTGGQSRAVPLIVIADPSREQQAAGFLERGAAGYLCTDHLGSLGAAVRQALDRRRQAISPLRMQDQPGYQLLFDGARDVILFVRLDDGQILDANPAADQAYGYSRDELLSLTIYALCPPETHARVNEQMQQAYDSRGTLFEAIHLRKSGQAFPVEVSSMGTSFCGERVNLSIIRDISQRRSAEEALLEREHQLDQIIQQMPLPIAIGAPDGPIQTANRAFLDLLGIRSESEFLGHFTPTTNPWVAFKGLTGPIQKAQQGEVVIIPEVPIHPSPEWKAQYGGGVQETHFFEITFFPVFNEAGQVWRIVTIWKDITQIKAHERVLQRQMVELEALHDVAQAGTEAACLDDLFERVAGIIHARLFPDDFGIALLDKAGTQLVYHPSARLHGTALRLSIPIHEGVSGAVARTGLPRRVGDVLEDPDYVESNPSIRSELCVPVTAGNRVIGVVNVESTEPNHFTPADERMLVAVAGELGIAIEKVRLLEEERGRRRELEALGEISAAVREAQSRDHLLAAVLDCILDALDCQGACIAFRDPQDGSMLFEQGRGEWETARGLRLPPGIGIGDQVASNQQPYVTADTCSDPLLYRQAFVKTTPCLLCLPLVVNGETTGLLYLGRGIPFRPNDTGLAESMANIVASALHRIQLHQQTEEQLARLTALRAIDQSILSVSDLNTTLGVLLEKVTCLLHVDAVDIFVYDPASRLLRITNERGYSPAHGHKALVRLGESHAGKVALERQLEYIPDLSQVKDSMTERLEETGEAFTSYLALPLVAKGELKGVLQIFHRTRLDPTPDWIEFLKALADQAAIAIDNAMLLDNQQKTNLRLIQAYEDTIDGWSHALDLRDRETEGHSHRVSELTLRLARQLGIPEEDLPHIRRGAQLHDIGKMAIPDSILHKAGPLTGEEWDIMRRHPLYALDLLYPIDFLQPSLEIPYYHHEKWDGTGYPQGLQGEDIPLAARIFAVVDVWDALTHDRPYRQAWTAEQARRYLCDQSGKHFDPRVVEVFLALGLIQEPTRSEIRGVTPAAETPGQMDPHDHRSL